MEINLTRTEAKYLLSAISNQVTRNLDQLNEINAKDMLLDMTANLQDVKDRIMAKLERITE